MDVERNPHSDSLPLREWRLQNFKSIPEASISLAPLTVLVGANSSGKSSVLQSILLVAQAAQGDSQGEAFPLNGPFASLGGFEDMCFALSSRGRAVSIGGAFNLQPQVVSATLSWRQRGQPLPESVVIDWQLWMDALGIKEPGSASISRADVAVSQGSAGAESAAVLGLRADRRGQGEIPADAEQFRVGRLVSPTREEFSLGYTGTFELPEHEPIPVRGLRFHAGIPHRVLTEWPLGEAAARVWVEVRTELPFWTGSIGLGPRARLRTSPSGGRSLKGTWPEAVRTELTEEPDIDRLIVQWADVAAEEIHRWRRRQTTKKPEPLPLFLARERQPMETQERLTLRGLSSELVDAIAERLGDLDEPVLLPPETDVAVVLSDLMSELFAFFRDRVVYLGPLRQDPQVVYRSTPFGATGFIGTKGEYMAPVLHAFRAHEVQCPFEDGTLRNMPLVEAVDYWTNRLDLAESVQTRDIGRMGIEVKVSRSELLPSLDLTSVGVGISQVLPVIVTCLRTPPGSLILLEQPELHLHPAVQQKLGDFLLAVAGSGRQLIVETHSEYLVSRLRRKIAEDETNETLSTVTIIFAEQRAEASSFRVVETNKFGAIEEWPLGFFDQSATESKRILEAGIRKRRSARGEKSGS